MSLEHLPWEPCFCTHRVMVASPPLSIRPVLTHLDWTQGLDVTNAITEACNHGGPFVDRNHYFEIQ